MNKMTPFDSEKSVLNVAVLGVGLIGGSIIKRLVSSRSVVNEINISTWNHSTRHNDELHKLDVKTYDSMADLLKNEFDIIIISTPIQTLGDIFETISRSGIRWDTIIMDVASVKKYPYELAWQHQIAKNYVGVHPLYGTEHTGFENSTPNLGDDAIWAVCAEDTSNPDKLETVRYFIEQHLVGHVVFTDSQTHDQAVAVSSHLPHVLAYEVAGTFSDGSKTMQLASTLNAGSFHGATRVAHGNTEMFRGMLLQNSDEIVGLLRKVSGDLTDLADSLESTTPSRRTKSVQHFISRSDSFRGAEISLDLHRHSGDGWVKCRCGKEHWGTNGAAGLFLVRLDQSDNVTHLLLQHRALWSAEGGTWGTPGGAIDHGESPSEGALREAYEEAGVKSEDVIILGSKTRDHIDWQFTTVFALEKPQANIIPTLQDQESLDIKWVQIDEVRKLPLLTAFGREFDELLEMIGCLIKNQSK